MFDKNTIIDLLKKKGWSRYKLCKEANLAQSTLSDILNGKKLNPRMDTIQKIADALDVSVDTFFTQSKKIHDVKSYLSNEEDSDIIRIERARKKMPEEEKETMMKVLEAAFEKYFKD